MIGMIPNCEKNKCSVMSIDLIEHVLIFTEQSNFEMKQ